MSKQLKISKVVTDDVAAVEVTFDLDEWTVVTARGSAKRHPKDDPNPGIGLALATSRALVDLAKELETIAQGQIDRPTPWPRPSGSLNSFLANAIHL